MPPPPPPQSATRPDSNTTSRTMISEPSPSRTQSSVRSSQSSNAGHAIQSHLKFATSLRRKIDRQASSKLPCCEGYDTNSLPFNFDCALDPGFIFIPTDLPYFIEFELKDRQRRKIQADSGVISKRAVPTPEMYKRYQIDKGIIALDAIGGQYLPFFLKHYLLPDLPFDVSQYYSKPKEWHGAPLASIRRCLLVLGSARLRSLPVQTRLELEKLRNLYFLDNEGDSPPLDNNFLDAVTQTPSDNKRKKRKLDNTTPDKPPSPKKQQDAQQGEDGHSYNKGATTFCPILQKEVPAYWSLGPDVSTEEAVCRFAPVLAQSPESVL
ncbi:hypothetical protein ETB97_007301 [Aspergillus alliaceus]|uniref:Uncharacterized protein n=1 Tax=Petromyces alliaceus TaxID=209559 RepID=A0A8H6E326_PETAA|nr:hypothetical protein ETB97_007301 [Aspergillus burnettii]